MIPISFFQESGLPNLPDFHRFSRFYRIFDSFYLFLSDFILQPFWVCLPAEPVPMRVFPVAALGLGGALLGRATSCQGVAGDACIVDLVDLVEADENLLLQHQRSSLAL